MKEILPVKRFQAMYLIMYAFAWKEKWTDIQLYTHSRAMPNGLARWSRAWNEHD